jgi:hypothetical protein
VTSCDAAEAAIVAELPRAAHDSYTPATQPDTRISTSQAEPCASSYLQAGTLFVTHPAMRIPFLLGCLALVVACDGTAVTFPEDGSGGRGSGASGSGTGSGANGAGTGTSNGGSTGDGGSGGTGGGPMCDMEPFGNTLCVRGESNGTSLGETLRAGGPVTFEVYPEGCFSSSCTETIVAECSVDGGALGALAISAKFCLNDTSEQPGGCTADCGGAETASCGLNAIEAGKYTASPGDLQLDFTVPSTLPFGGECISRVD